MLKLKKVAATNLIPLRKEWCRIMKRPVSVFLAAAILISMFINYPIHVKAAGGNAIAIMVEQNSFDNSNVGGDGENTLLWMKGNSTLNGGQLLLTNNSWQAGSVVKRNQVKLTDGFSTYFQMNFSGNADGIAFVLYKSDAPKLGENGGALGYGDKEFEYSGSDAGIKDGIDNSIHDSIVVEFDTWRNYGDNSDQYDLNDAGYDNHVAIMLDGNQAHVQQSDNGAAVYTNASLSGQTINAWVDYNSGNGTDTTGTVTVTFGTGATKDDAANHTISRTIRVSDNTPIAGDNVFVGFTSSTGGNATTHKLLKWYFKDSYAAGGLNPTVGTYTQAPATLSVVPNNAGTNPTNADITIKDDSGDTMANETFDVYIDDSVIPEGTPGDYNTGAGAVYSFAIPSNLSNGSHTIRVVGEGGVTNFATFTVDKHTVTYNGNGNTGGTVPSASIHNDGTTVTVSANSGSLVKTGYDFAGWNTQADGSGTTYHAGSGQISNISSDITMYAVWSKFSASEGNSSFITSGDAVVIDSGIIIEGFTESISGARVMIQNKKTGDILSYTNAGGINGTYDSTAGVLTLEGNATSAQYQTALRSVKFSTTSNDTTDRTILFSLGGGLYHSGNGHFYEYVDSLNISWSDAKVAAEGRSLYGRQGYLATLTSAEENAFVTDKVTALGWIGAKDIHYVDINSDDNLGDWRWVTGPEGLADGGNGTRFYSGYNGASGTTVTYSNWWQGEPNNGDNVEYVAHIFGPTDTMPAWARGSSNPASPGEWNDFEPNRNDGAVKGYVVEYGGMPDDTPIVVQAAKTITVNTLSNDATLKSTTKIKGVTVTDFGTPSATIGGVTAGSATLTAVQGADTSNTGSYITSFVANNAAGTVNKVVKYASGTATTNFDTTDTAYNGTNEIVNGDFFVVRVTAEDSTVNYYKITVTVNSPLSSDAGLSSVLGQAITAGAEDGTSGAPKIASISVTNAVSTVAVTNIVKHDAGATVIFYGTDSTFTTPAVGSVNLTAGSGADVYIKVTAADSTTLYYKVTINRASAHSSGGSTPSTPATPNQPTDTGVEILVNGKTETAATATTIQEGNQTVTTVTVDNKKIVEKLQAEGNNATVTIPVKNNADVVVGQLNGQTIKNMETKEAVLEMKTENVTYTLPALEINIDNVSEQIGKQIELKDIKVNVAISAPPQDTVKEVENAANRNNYQVVVKPIEFSITCTSGNKTVEVSKFNGYVERMLAIPDGIDPSKITTGIVLNSDGTFSHVPTAITIIDGKYYAKINSLTNSTYSVIWSPKTFKDVENHWAKDAVNDMGSRLVISGVGNGMFEPDRDITRGEFASIVVKALGLMRPGTGKASFSDVTKNDWYYDAGSIAYEYDIISGYGNGKFGPMDRITREQAMTMIARAMKISGLKAEIKDSEVNSLLANYADGAAASTYAKTSIAACLKTGIITGRIGNTIAPRDYITRAESAVIVQRLLKKSNLI